MSSSRNCSLLQELNKKNIESQMLETSVLSFFLFYIVISNMFVIVVTIGSAQLRGCLFSMQMAATYMGNILAGMKQGKPSLNKYTIQHA